MKRVSFSFSFFCAMPADSSNWAWPTETKWGEGPPSRCISPTTCKYGIPYVMATHHMQGGLVTKRCEFPAVQSRLLFGGALDYHSYCCISAHRFMAMVVIEFGGLKELADVADNYHTNINKLYGNFNKFTLAIDKVVRNIVVSMYAHYIDRWPINGACVGHQALLMWSMLEFKFIYGRYCHCELHFTLHTSTQRQTIPV